MAAAYDEALDTLADTGLWEDAIAVLAGFLAPSVARNVIEGRTDFDAPDELYGLIVVMGGQFSPMYPDMMSLGGGLYTADKALERFGLKQTITSMGGN